jgi:hypothetical protein
VKTKTRRRIASGGYLIILGGFLVWMFFPPSARVELVFKGFSTDSKLSRKGTPINYAHFELKNRGSQTIYYEGDPLPACYLETERNGVWVGDEMDPRLDILAPIFPRHTCKFRVLVPMTENRWRLVVRWIKPSSAPVTLRRFFVPRTALLISPDLAPIPPRPTPQWATTAKPGGGGGSGSLMSADLSPDPAAR